MKAVILYAEDEPSDVMFLRRAIRKANLDVELVSVSDARFVVLWLRGEAPFNNRNAYPLPDLIITDLKMPLMHGFELLRYLNKHPVHYQIPVVVHSTSEYPSDMENAMRLGAIAYFVKTTGCQNVTDFLRGWLATREPEPVAA